MEFKLARGIHVQNVDGIHEAYAVQKGDKGFTQITVNVSADRLERVVRELATLVREPAFLVLECGTHQTEEAKLRKLPSDPFHKDVYYLDGLTQKGFLSIFDSYHDL